MSMSYVKRFLLLFVIMGVFFLIVSNWFPIHAEEFKELDFKEAGSVSELMEYVESDDYFYYYNEIGESKEEVNNYYKIEVTKPGYLIIADYDSLEYSNDDPEYRICYYLYSNKMMTNAVKYNYDMTKINGDVYKAKCLRSYYVKKGIYYIKETGTFKYNGSDYSHIAYVAFMPAEVLVKLDKIDYDDNNSSATVYISLVNNNYIWFDIYGGDISLSDGVTNRRTDIVTSYNNWNGWDKEQVSNILLSGYEIKENGTYSFCVNFLDEAYTLFPGVLTVEIDQIGAETKSVEAKSVKMSKTKVSLKVGETTTLKATIKPKNVTDKTVTWKSSNKKVATVDKNGKVTAKKKGTCTITATTSNGKKAKCKVTVKK